ncbi:hypothetical protein G4228_001960 [Cervus hanglu yarkandensis]|nr:hypothetical protein G4228_001960 [Cervus hanglu yarkandensis]
MPRCSHSGSSSSEENHQSLRPDSMAARDLAVAVIFLSQTIFGMLGNFCVLYHYFFLCCTGQRLRTIDLIVKNLIVANILVLFSSGFHDTVKNFEWHFMDSDFACRFFPYVRVVGRGESIGTTFLLSVFQAITICPTTAKWAELKVKALKCMLPSVIFCWTLNILVKVIYPMYISGTLRNRSITNRKDLGQCSAVSHGQPIDSLYAVLLSFPEALCFVLMILASGFTVFILYRHKQRVQNFRSTNISSIFSPESRATKTILLLVFTFIFFNILTFLCNIILAVFDSIDVFFVKISAVIIACFPTVSPFLFMSRDSRISRNCFAGIKHSKSPILICANSHQ